MKFTSEDGKKQTFNEINITPLTDIFLVLLIIMMVIAPSFQSNNSEIKLPQIKTGKGVEAKNTDVSITKDGLFFINGKQTDGENLANELSLIVDKAEKKEVVVKADKKTKSSQIMKVMRASQEAGFEKMIIAGEPLTNLEQNKLKNNIQNDDELLNQNNIEE